MHTFKTTVLISLGDGGERELPLAIHYDFQPGTQETGAGYLADPDGYDPGSGDEIDIRSIVLGDGDQPLDVPSWLAKFIEWDEGMRASLTTNANPEESAR